MKCSHVRICHGAGVARIARFGMLKVDYYHQAMEMVVIAQLELQIERKMFNKPTC